MDGWGWEDTASRLRTRSAEKPRWARERRSKVATKSPATKRTTKQNATWSAIRQCIKRRRECGSSPPLSANTGFTDEVRRAGAAPNKRAATKARSNENAAVRQSAESVRCAGLSGESM